MKDFVSIFKKTDRKDHYGIKDRNTCTHKAHRDAQENITFTGQYRGTLAELHAKENGNSKQNKFFIYLIECLYCGSKGNVISYNCF